MAADREGHISVNPGDSPRADSEGISPIAFEPVAAGSKRFVPRVSPAVVIIALLLLTALSVLWFLLTARSLVIITEPAAADIKLKGGAVFRLADHYLVRPGDYSVEAITPGYFAYNESFTVSNADNQQLLIRLDKMPGTLQVTTGDRQADLILDGELRGQTPLTVEGIAPGTHRIELKAARYLPESLDIDIEGLGKTQTLAVELEPAWGYVSLATSPPGADVLVAGEFRGQTPVRVEVLAAGESVAVKLPGYKRWEKQLAVNPGETRELETIALEPADGLVMISSRPAGATLLVNGSYRGITPLEVQLPPQQDHRLQMFLDGYQSARRVLSVDSGTEQTVELVLQPELGKVQVSTRPTGAELYVDGRRLGVDGDTLELPARPHRLEVRKDGYHTVTRTIVPRPDLNQVLQIQLLTEAAALLASLPAQISANGIALKLFKPDQSFVMGSSRREQGRRANEVRRNVTLDRPFYLATTEVTNQAFKKFRSEHSSSHASGVTLDLPNQPVVRVSWLDAALFCNWLSTAEGLSSFYQIENGKLAGQDPLSTGYRLPTEAEWAWAARVRSNGEELKYPWGGSLPPPPKAGNYADLSASKIVGRIVQGYRDGFAASAPVGSFSGNDKGLFDLGGNVAEWTNDYYGIVPDMDGKNRVNPLGPDSGEYRVIRDASWRQGSITELRLSFRDYGLEPRDDLGFRIARYAR